MRQTCSPTGNSSHSLPGGLWGPDDGRLSRPVLRAAGGAIPPADSPLQRVGANCTSVRRRKAVLCAMASGLGAKPACNVVAVAVAIALTDGLHCRTRLHSMIEAAPHDQDSSAGIRPGARALIQVLPGKRLASSGKTAVMTALRPADARRDEGGLRPCGAPPPAPRSMGLCP